MTSLHEECSRTPSGEHAFVDRFEQDVAAGRAIGSRTPGGTVRRGVDREKVIGIDHGALRIQPLVKPGWARSGIAYGPFRREPGLAFHVFILNGHNLSRTEPLPDGFRGRMERWIAGTEVETPLQRLGEWLRAGNKRHMWRRFRQWVRSGAELFYWPWLEENLALGWFPAEAPTHPLRQGCHLAVKGIVPEGGELFARVGTDPAPTVRGLQGVPIYYTVVLRERGAAYYASSPADVPGMARFPNLRLLAVDPFNADETLFAGIHQSALGEIGFRADTRVYGAQVAQLTALKEWYGTAHAADSLCGEGALSGSAAEVGGRWSTASRIVRTGRGAVGEAEPGVALLFSPSPAGLVHMLVDCAERPAGTVGIVWRAVDERNFWCFEVGADFAQLALVEDGRWQRHARVAGRHLPPSTVSSLQIYDDGERIRVYVNGKLVYGTTLHDTRLASATGVGFLCPEAGTGIALRSFEAHPREIRIAELEAFEGPRVELGSRVVVTDSFAGPPGDLEGHETDTGSLRWERRIGKGRIEITGGTAARVKASAQEPCPGRTAYTIPWPTSEFADVQVTITPAGKRKGTREKGRSGVIFWQDEDNYLILSAFVEDWPAMSIAAFFRIRGFEELFDAVWTNVGTRMYWGEPHDFRATFDGRQFTAYLNGEPVLYRALTDVYPDCERLAINRAGIVANWEWGNDTGSTFENFVGRTR